MAIRRWIVLLAPVMLLGCSGISADSEYFGRVTPPEGQVLHYVSGSEPQTMDPQVGTGAPEARIYAALFDGLTEYHPQTAQPMPSLAERWDVNEDNSEFLFHLREDARWSDGLPITAQDVVYSWRRAVSPELASPYAYLAFHIQYSQAYNESGFFVRDSEAGQYLLNGDVDGDDTQNASSRVTLPGDEASRSMAYDARPNLAALVAGKELVPVRAEDIGVEAVDRYTVRVSLNQPVPFFPGLLTHQLLRPVPQQAIEAHGDQDWTDVGNMVTSGPFHLDTYQAYDKIIVVKSPTFWDADRVRLDSITFYPIEEQTTIMNLYKAGAVDAFLNHTVPIAWVEQMRDLGDYMDAPENGIEYYVFNTTRPPMDDVRVRKAFNAAIDKVALAEFKRTAKPLTAFTPEGIFPGYPQPAGDGFDPARARQLLADAGYADAVGDYDPEAFPITEVELTYNTSENNRQVAEFVQAQWKQNLGLTVPLKNMEWLAYLEDTQSLSFKGVARRGWGGDYMDPYTFLELFSTPTGNNGTGWFSEDFVTALALGNRSSDPDERFRLMAETEERILDVQSVIPLLTPSTNWMKKPYVKGLYPNPISVFPWKYVYIEHDPTLWDHGMPSLIPDGKYQGSSE